MWAYVAHFDHQVPQVELFEYGEDPVTICGDYVCGSQRVCVALPGICTFKHSPKLDHKLAAGFYIRLTTEQGGALIYVYPLVSADTAATSQEFESTRDTTASLAIMNCIFMATINGTSTTNGCGACCS